MSDITCDYCGERQEPDARPKFFLRGYGPNGCIWACISCMAKIATGDLVSDAPFIDTPLGQTPIDQQRP